MDLISAVVFFADLIVLLPSPLTRYLCTNYCNNLFQATRMILIGLFHFDRNLLRFVKVIFGASRKHHFLTTIIIVLLRIREVLLSWPWLLWGFFWSGSFRDVSIVSICRDSKQVHQDSNKQQLGIRLNKDNLCFLNLIGQCWPWIEDISINVPKGLVSQLSQISFT